MDRDGEPSALTGLVLRTGAWYGDRTVTFDIPSTWQLRTFWPRTPPPMSESELLAALEAPVGQPPIRELAQGKRKPVIIVDDLTRPTPAHRVMPLVLRQLREAGIGADQVTVVMGGGTHRRATPEQMMLKVGSAARGCRLIVHDHQADTVRVGRTSFGSPVIVNRQVAASDLLIGIGGIYPQHSVGFGGGSKLLLGVLGKRSIVSLHYGHGSVAGTYDVDNDFRRDLDEMARLVGLKTIITLHVNADREVVRAVSGDHHAYYRDGVAFSRHAYSAPAPGDADVVLVNAFPADVSLTFTRSKGMAPLHLAEAGASRILISACTEGLGYHGLFPFMNGPAFEKQIHRLRRVSVIKPSSVLPKLARRALRVAARARRQVGAGPSAPAAVLGGAEAPAREPRPMGQVWLHSPGGTPASLPPAIPGMAAVDSWAEVLKTVDREQGHGRRLVVAVYPCAPLHCLDIAGVEIADHLAAPVGQAG
jgi:nickel-dependent lactate racemase